MVTSSEFEDYGRRALLEILNEHSEGKKELNVNSYMSHLRRFRNYLENKSLIEGSKSFISLKVEVKKELNRDIVLLPRPSKEQVEYYLTRWATLEDYRP